MRTGLDDEINIDPLPPAWLNIYPAPADKVDLEECIRRAWDLCHRII